MHAFESEPPSCFYPAEGAEVKKVVLIQSNHFDGGYTAANEPARYSKRYTGALLDVVNMNFAEFFPAAAATANELRERGGPERLRYMTHAWLVNLYLHCPPRQGLACPSAAALSSFRAAVQRGDIWWHAMPHNAELATMAPETIRAAIGVTHAVDDELSVPRKKVASQRDVPGLPRAVIPLMKSEGVVAISVGANGAVIAPNVPPAFIAKDGEPANKAAAVASAG